MEKVKVLVVDDEKQVRTLSAKILQKYGYETVEAASVAGAQTALQTAHADDTPFGLVLTDCEMLPGDDGAALIQWMQQDANFKTIPVIMVSGNPGVAQAALQRIGMEGKIPLIGKPFNFAILKAQVEKSLASSVPEESVTVEGGVNRIILPDISP